jgi:hypothetical protein
MEQNEADRPQHYTWPRYVLAGVVLGIVLAIVWMAVLVRRIRDERDPTHWHTIPPTPAQAVTIPAAPTNAASAQPTPPTNVPSRDGQH